MFRPLLMYVALCVVYATSKPTEKKDRVHHKDPLSSREHVDGDGYEYDHEAFLGKEAKTFDELTPEESQHRLGLIVDKIDDDKDGFVTEAELEVWIKKTQNRYIYDSASQQWEEFDTNKDGMISWEEYRNITFGSYLDDPLPPSDEGHDYEKMMARDERRFKVADSNGDKLANKEEFTAFLHPDDFDHMKDIVVLETIEEIDKNGDGLIDLEEYIGDMYHPEEGKDEPEWVASERQQFNEFRDKNKDGKMDREETKDWILPSEYDQAVAESKHLIHESDSNKDGKLTKEEILNKHDLFVGSQATDFGEALTRHDEF